MLVQVQVHVGLISKLGSIDLCMECILMQNRRINLSFISLAFLGAVGFFASEKFKNI